MKYKITVTYSKPMSHGQNMQSYNADTMAHAVAIAQREFAKPLVKLVSISVQLEHWAKSTPEG